MSKANHWRQTAIAAQMLTLPSGMTVKVRRPSIEGLMIKKRMPDSIAREFLGSKVRRGATIEDIASQMEDQGVDAPKLIELMRFLVCESVVEPRVVLEGAAEDDDEKINIDDLPEADLAYLYKFAVNQLPDAPIATRNGGNGSSQLTVGAVNEFREGGEGAVTTTSSSDGPEIQPAAI